VPLRVGKALPGVAVGQAQNVPSLQSFAPRARSKFGEEGLGHVQECPVSHKVVDAQVEFVLSQSCRVVQAPWNTMSGTGKLGGSDAQSCTLERNMARMARMRAVTMACMDPPGISSRFL